MQIHYIDGLRLRNAVIAGTASVFQMREHLNKINLFPIPDKDTGTNLSATFRYVVELLQRSTPTSVEQTSKIMAEAALLAAQGNSGAILAQFFQGLAEQLEGQIRVTTHAFSLAVEKAVQKVYEAVSNPVEGTIISVLNDWSKALNHASQKSTDFVIVLRNALQQARISLSNTQDKIEILRKAGVVDAGAQGFVSLLEGISRFIEQGTIRDVLKSGVSELHSLPDVAFSNFDAEVEHRFCVECLLATKGTHKPAIQAELVNLGSSLAIANSKKLMKVHIHTNDPVSIRRSLESWGEIQSYRVNDLVQQQAEALRSQEAVKIALVTDSSCDLPHEIIMKYHIHIVPVRIHFGEKTFIDKQTITPLEFYEKLAESPVHPTTSQPSPANFRDVYENLAKQYPAILSINLASALSGTFRSAQTAAGFIENAEVVLIDSKTTSIALGMLLVEAGEAILAGKPLEAVAEYIRQLVPKVKLIINLPSLKYLARGGRISKGKGLIANLLNIKPLLTFDETGKVAELAKAFGKLGSLKKTVRMVKAQTAALTNIRIGIVHANAIGKAEWMANQLSDIPNIKSLIIHDVAPVLGVHAGPGTVAVAFWGDSAAV